MLHGRMQYGLERYQAEHPEVDILLIEPTRDDMRMFGYNIMRMSARKVVAEDGYRTVLKCFRKNHARYPPAPHPPRHRLADPVAPARRPAAPPPPLEPRPRTLGSRRSSGSSPAWGPPGPSSGRAASRLLPEPDRAASRETAVDHPLDRRAHLL